MKFSVETLTQAADLVTPVSLYANLRQLFPETLLLECVEARSLEDSASYLCADPVLRFSVRGKIAKLEHNGRQTAEIELRAANQTVAAFRDFQNSIEFDRPEVARELAGLFGYVGFSAIPLLEDIEFAKTPDRENKIPDLQFALYRYVFRFDHFRHTLTAIRLTEANETTNALPLPELFERISRRRAVEFEFARRGDEIAETTDADFAGLVETCQRHIRRGDVFQIVPSRRFAQNYSGDEFQVYRQLRQINPSPFLFFYDYGGFSLFGSSPEAQLTVKNSTAALNPIAGTYARGRDAEEDRILSAKLQADAKESAEHIMLVDLARNDLGRHCERVTVERFKETELFSHVIHLVSRVSGAVESDADAFQIFADTFPAGTLSGAPKYRAMQILNNLEPSARSFYGGSVGFFGFDNSATLAIMIRSFLAKNRTLTFQAGAGVVADSVPQTETAEVKNKLAALRRAIQLAEKR